MPGRALPVRFPVSTTVNQTAIFLVLNLPGLVIVPAQILPGFVKSGTGDSRPGLPRFPPEAGRACAIPEVVLSFSVPAESVRAGLSCALSGSVALRRA